MRRIAFAAIALISVFASPSSAEVDIWSILKKPGHIVLLRHANAPGSVPESNDMDFDNCAIQRNLDAGGRAQAARIGDAFRKQGISKATLLSSQYCRAKDTATLLKLGPIKTTPDLNQTFLLDPDGMRAAGVKAIATMRTFPLGQFAVLVTHLTNIQSIANVSLDPGEFAVVHFDPRGAVVVDGRLAIP